MTSLGLRRRYVKADKAGDASGKLNLGSMYERGVAVKKRDLRRAFILYKCAFS